ncbi:MAG: helix-turn-helix domain-containing protein [Actinomycetota bacterium]
MHAIHSETELRPFDQPARADFWLDDEREVFLDLVEGKALSRIRARAGRLGFDLGRPHTPIACRSGAVATAATTERTMAALREALLDSLAAAFPPGGPRVFVGAVEGRELLAFLPTDDRRLVGQVGLATLRRTAAWGRATTIGIGPPCLSPEDFSRNADRARWAAEILQLTDIDRRIAGFEELGVYTLLFNVDHPDELEAFMRRWIGALIDYDEKRNADLVTTLGALLEGRGLRQAAEQLVIHVSTLKYRIKRINEILGLDYHDPEIAFNLQLAVRLYRISRGGRSAEPPERTTS